MVETARTRKTVREAVAVLHDAASLENAVSELREEGFAAESISLLAGADTVAEKLGHAYSRVEELEDEPEAPRTEFVSSEAMGRREDMVISSLIALPTLLAAGVVVASAGAVAAALTGTAIAGAAIGTALARWMDKRHAAWLQEQLEHGGILLWVRTDDEAEERKAITVLTRHSAHDVHIHEIPGPR